jgi:hypothetical protein
VRALVALHKVPYAHSLVLSGSDDGTIRVWKNAKLVEGEKEGMRQAAERRAQAEHEEKRRAKESVELERQRQKNELAKMKAAVPGPFLRAVRTRCPWAGRCRLLPCCVGCPCRVRSVL